MKAVRVPVASLLTILEENRNQHRDVVEKAWVGYREAAIKSLDDLLTRVRSGSKQRVYVVLELPVDHTADYERAIKMLKMSVDPVIEVDEKTFKNLVEDEWDWSDQFRNTNSTYTSVD